MRRTVRTAVTSVLLAAGLASAAEAAPNGAGLVIREVYGAGGNTGAARNADYVELFNPTNGPIGLGGLFVQYRSATSGGGVASTAFALSGTVPATTPYLIQMSATGATGAALPTPDAGPANLAVAAAGGQVILTEGNPSVGTGDLAGAANVIDMVGATGSSSFETAPTTSPATATSSLNRSAAGADTNSNAADFATAAPSPENCGAACSSMGATGATGATGPTAVAVTIAEIQGDNTDASPLAGRRVETSGRVTASYPTGGLNGFYLQTGGTPNTPDASDAVFVFGGASGFTSYPAVGDAVQVVGTVSERNVNGGSLTQITATTADVTAVMSLSAVVPQTQVPGTTCTPTGGDCLVGAALDAAREKHEGELYQPTQAYTVTDAYDFSPFPSTSSSFFGEVGLAANDELPLIQPTELHDAGTPEITARTNYNDARRIVLDDGSSTNYSSSANTGRAIPWLTVDHTVRVGAAVTFPKPVVLTWAFDGWTFLPQGQVIGDPTGTVDFEQDRPARPAPVGGQVRLGTFNVLNYFPTTGEEFVASGQGTCSYFSDRQGNRIATSTCSPNGPRGAANPVSLERQRDKIVAAINLLDADVVALEELENSVKFLDGDSVRKDRDFAIGALVSALNAAAGTGTWAFVPSPPASELPTLAEQDVIRLGFIYKPARVALVGPSKVLVGSSAFGNARQPLAQAFKAVGDPDSKAFAVVGNHFKSKGSGTDDRTGQGLANPDRVAQATALVQFAEDFKQARGVTKVFLTGDFNAYSMEDPIQVLEAAGYTDLTSTSDPDETSYSFGGQVGSLDHVLANAAAVPDVTGVDIWTINAAEPVFFQYSRFNFNVTNLYAPGPFGSSDHNPEIVGITPTAVDPPGPTGGTGPTGTTGGSGSTGAAGPAGADGGGPGTDAGTESGGAQAPISGEQAPIGGPQAENGATVVGPPRPAGPAGVTGPRGLAEPLRISVTRIRSASRTRTVRVTLKNANAFTVSGRLSIRIGTRSLKSVAYRTTRRQTRTFTVKLTAAQYRRYVRAVRADAASIRLTGSLTSGATREQTTKVQR